MENLTGAISGGVSKQVQGLYNVLSLECPSHDFKSARLHIMQPTEFARLSGSTCLHILSRTNLQKEMFAVQSYTARSIIRKDSETNYRIAL